MGTVYVWAITIVFANHNSMGGIVNRKVQTLCVMGDMRGITRHSTLYVVEMESVLPRIHANAIPVGIGRPIVLRRRTPSNVMGFHTRDPVSVADMEIVRMTIGVSVNLDILEKSVWNMWRSPFALMFGLIRIQCVMDMAYVFAMMYAFVTRSMILRRIAKGLSNAMGYRRSVMIDILTQWGVQYARPVAIEWNTRVVPVSDMESVNRVPDTVSV